MVKKDDLERYLSDKLEDITDLEVKQRGLKVQASKEFISSIYGPRRAGKSYFLYSLIKRMDPRGALYLNFEDIQLGEWTPWDIVGSVSIFYEIFDREPEYILMDEIQNVKGWETAVNTLYEKKRYKIFLTGSSSRFLAKEIATTLRGRSIGYPMLPLSFREYLRFLGSKTFSPKGTRGIAEVNSKLDSYLSKGSFPGPLFEKGLLGKFYDEYLDLVIYRDLVDRYGITNLGLMKFLIKNIIRSFSKEFSLNRLYNDWRSMRYEASKKTLYQYFTYLEDAMFVFPLKKYSRSERTSELSIPKIYLPDTGLPSFTSGYQKGRAMENCVFLELYRNLTLRNGMDLYFWRDRSQEVDFIICSRDEPVELVQVTEFLTRENHKREVDALEKVGDQLGCKKRTMITWTGEEKAGDGVKVLPLRSFLLREP